MKIRFAIVCGLLLAFVASAQAQRPAEVSAVISVDAPVVVLNHVRVIDGTGSAARDDQAVVITNGKIATMGPAASVQAPAGAQVLDRAGYTVIPGLVGMHDHLYYTDSISVQVVNGNLEEPGLFVAELLLYGAAEALPGGGRDDDAHDRQRGALYGPEDQEAD